MVVSMKKETKCVVVVVDSLVGFVFRRLILQLAALHSAVTRQSTGSDEVRALLLNT